SFTEPWPNIGVRMGGTLRPVHPASVRDQRAAGRVPRMDIPNMGVPAKLADRMSMAEQHEYLRARFSRRRMLRAGAVTVGAVAVGGALGGGTAFAARAGPQLLTGGTTDGIDGSLVAPIGRHLQFGPEPDTQFRISWQVPAPVKKPFLRFGKTPWELSHKV